MWTPYREQTVDMTQCALLTGLSLVDDPSGRLAMSQCPRLDEICREMARRWDRDKAAELSPVIWLDSVRQVA